MYPVAPLMKMHRPVMEASASHARVSESLAWRFAESRQRAHFRESKLRCRLYIVRGYFKEADAPMADAAHCRAHASVRSAVCAHYFHALVGELVLQRWQVHRR